jgi:hypothetical protein
MTGATVKAEGIITHVPEFHLNKLRVSVGIKVFNSFCYCWHG